MVVQGLVRWSMLAALVMCFLATQGEGAPGELGTELGTVASASDVSFEGATAGADGARARRSTAAAGDGEESSDYNADEPGDYEDGDADGDEDEAPSGPPPSFLSSPLNLTLRPGDNATLPCRIDRESNLPRIWLNGSQTLSVNLRKLGGDRIEVSPDMSLTIYNAKPEDTGLYTCQITSNPVANLTHFIRVPLPAKIVKHSEKMTVMNGNPLELSCIVEGIPQPVVTWTLQGLEVPDATFENGGSILKVSSVNKHHAGIYECTANNGIGKDVSVTINVQVSTKPQVTVLRDMIKSGEGETIELVCNVTGQPKPYMKWYKDREAVEIGTSRYEASAQGITYTLRISNLEKSDFGTYSCTAKNKFGSRQKNITVSGTPNKPKYAGHDIQQDKIILRWYVESSAPIRSHELRYRKAGNDDDWIILKPEVKDSENNNYKVEVEMPVLPSGHYEAFLRSENQYGSTDSDYANFEGQDTKPKEESENEKPAAETSKRGPDSGSSAPVVCSMTLLLSTLMSAFAFSSLAYHL